MKSVMRLFVGYAMLAQSISAMAQTPPSSRPDAANVQKCLDDGQLSVAELRAIAERASRMRR